MPRYSLFIDDERFPPQDRKNWVIARNWENVMMSLRMHGMPGFISFDHDLGDDTHSGMDIAKFLVNLDIDGEDDFKLPPEFDFYVHSQNPVGKENIEKYLRQYLEFRKHNV
jgi:hypothetical protein